MFFRKYKINLDRNIFETLFILEEKNIKIMKF